MLTRQTPYNDAHDPMVLGFKIIKDGLKPVVPNSVPKKYQFKDFRIAFAFMTKIATYADQK